MSKTRLNLSLDHDLVDFLKVYAQENRTTVSEMMTQFILSLKRKSEGDSMELIVSDPHFYSAIRDVQSRLREGKAKWHSFEDVFGEQ